MAACPSHPDGPRSPSGKCRVCNRRYQAIWVGRNPELHKQRRNANAARARAINRENLWVYLSEHPCVDCGISDPRVLQADHVADNKRDNIAALVLNASWASVLDELRKCEMRCANCHQIKTAERSGTWRHVRYWSGRIPSRL